VSLWKCRAVENVENQRQVSHLSHRAWKSQKARFPHSHRPGYGGSYSKTQNPGSRPAGRKPKPLPAGALAGYKKV
jgi:hypothetical protein